MSFWREALGLESKAAKRQKRYDQAYVAAMTSRLTADWNASYNTADSELKVVLAELRARCRDMARNDPYVRRYLNLRQNNIVGDKGFSHQVKAMVTGGDRPDTGGNAIVEDAWKIWGRKGNCTPCGQLSWIDLQKNAQSALDRDGEAWFQIIRGRRFPHSFAISQFEGDKVDEKKNELARNGNEIRMGVELNSDGRPVAYHIFEDHPGDNEFRQLRDRKTRRVPAENIIHLFHQTRPGQTRGEPPLAPVLGQIKMLNAHREAELVASRVAASKMGFFTSDLGDEFEGDDPNNTSFVTMDVEPGMMRQLPPGMNFTEFNPTHPSTAFADYQKGMLRGIASVMGVSYASLANDLSETSYSSIRQGALEERDVYQNAQQFLCEHFIKPVYMKWLEAVMSFNHINLPIRQFDKFYDATEFRGRGWAWVDPAKEIAAVSDGMHNGIMSPQDAANQYGRDFEEVMQDFQQAQEIAQRYGQEISFGPFGGNKATKGQPEAQEMEQDNE